MNTKTAIVFSIVFGLLVGCLTTELTVLERRVKEQRGQIEQLTDNMTTLAESTVRNSDSILDLRRATEAATKKIAQPKPARPAAGCYPQPPPTTSGSLVECYGGSATIDMKRPAGWLMNIHNSGPGPVTVRFPTTINGQSSPLTLPVSQWVRVVSDGDKWFAWVLPQTSRTWTSPLNTYTVDRKSAKSSIACSSDENTASTAPNSASTCCVKVEDDEGHLATNCARYR